MSLPSEPFVERATALNLRPTSDHEKPLLTAFEHELGNALSVVSGHAELLSMHADERLDEDQRAWLRSLVAACQRARDVTESYLSLARPGAPQGPEFAPSCLLRIVEHAVRSASWAASEAGVSVRFVPFSGASQVHCDLRAINKLLRDLMSLLLDAGGPGAELVVRGISGTDVLTIDLRCHPGDAARECFLSDVVLRAWRRVLVLHGGALQFHADTLSARIVLPTAHDSDASAGND